ncbi:unnamed protein product [Pleuronectes platessa]|uniref:Uncharacterized protein n=1 Tax=Pleuronectes platessa TaxID=8262 RepID=A0A9N7Z9Z3_PLEPL|nr:unnamed protein product [Pleuronectes platessa]
MWSVLRFDLSSLIKTNGDTSSLHMSIRPSEVNFLSEPVAKLGLEGKWLQYSGTQFILTSRSERVGETVFVSVRVRAGGRGEVKVLHSLTEGVLSAVGPRDKRAGAEPVPACTALCSTSAPRSVKFLPALPDHMG